MNIFFHRYLRNLTPQQSCTKKYFNSVCVLLILTICLNIFLVQFKFFKNCHGFVPCFVNYKKGCTRLAAASDKVYQLLAHGRWFSPGTPASSTTKTGRHAIAEILLKVALKHQKSNQIKSILPIYYVCLKNPSDFVSCHAGWIFIKFVPLIRRLRL